MSKLKLKKFSYFSIALLRDISFSENVEKLLVSGVLYILKHIHFLLVKVSSEHKHLFGLVVSQSYAYKISRCKFR